MSPWDIKNGLIVCSTLGLQQTCIWHYKLPPLSNLPGEILQNIFSGWMTTDNGIEDWGAWLKGLWEGTGLAEAVSGQIENELVDTRCNSTEAKENGEIDSAAGTQTPVELTEQNAQTSGDNPHTSTIMTPFQRDDGIIYGDDNDLDCDEDRRGEAFDLFYKNHALLSSLKQSNAISKEGAAFQMVSILYLSMHSMEKRHIWKPKFLNNLGDRESMHHLKGKAL